MATHCLALCCDWIIKLQAKDFISITWLATKSQAPSPALIDYLWNDTTYFNNR